MKKYKINIIIMKSHLSNFVSENTIVTLLSIKERK